MINPSCENSCRILVESLNHVFFTLDDLGTFSYISPNCSEILGFLPEEMTGRPVSAFVIPEDTGNAGEACGQDKQEKTHSSHFSMVGKDGRSHPAMVISRLVPDGQEKTGIIGIIDEISTGKQAEKLILNANNEIHLFNSIIRHDINNQLTVLNGYLSLMEQDDGMITSPEIVRILLDATDKIHKMITFTTEYKDIGTRLPMWNSLYASFESARSAIGAAGVQITIDPACREIELFTVPALTKVFHQLIDNSLLHGKSVSEISLRWRPEDGGAIMVYEDNGTGIPESIRPTLFQPGKRNKTGYGLFLIHEILGISGFSITETGTPGKGVRFEILVPAGSFRVIKRKLS